MAISQNVHQYTYISRNENVSTTYDERKKKFFRRKWSGL